MVQSRLVAVTVIFVSFLSGRCIMWLHALVRLETALKNLSALADFNIIVSEVVIFIPFFSIQIPSPAESPQQG